MRGFADARKQLVARYSERSALMPAWRARSRLSAHRLHWVHPDGPPRGRRAPRQDSGRDSNRGFRAWSRLEDGQRLRTWTCADQVIDYLVVNERLHRQFILYDSALHRVKIVADTGAAPPLDMSRTGPSRRRPPARGQAPARACHSRPMALLCNRILTSSSWPSR